MQERMLNAESYEEFIEFAKQEKIEWFIAYSANPSEGWLIDKSAWRGHGFFVIRVDGGGRWRLPATECFNFAVQSWFESQGRGNPISKQDEYRGFATDCLDLAQSSRIPADKTRLLLMAEAWVTLAKRADRSGEHPVRKIADHPLVSEALGDGE
jgi:hypothetical protein